MFLVQVAGCRYRFDRRKPIGSRIVETDIDASRSYRIVCNSSAITRTDTLHLGDRCGSSTTRCWSPIFSRRPGVLSGTAADGSPPDSKAVSKTSPPLGKRRTKWDRVKQRARIDHGRRARHAGRKNCSFGWIVSGQPGPKCYECGFLGAGPVALDPVSVQHGEERSEVRIWGRTYRFTQGPLPAAITTAGQEILDAPMRLVGSVDGQPIEWQRSGLQVLRQSPGQATICGWQANASLILDAVVQGRDDGMVRLDLVVLPQQTPNPNSSGSGSKSP